MKRIFIIFSALCAAVSCAGNLNLPSEPKTPQSGIFEVSAQVSSYSGEFLWNEGNAIGVYGTVEGANAKYVPYDSYLGKAGLVKMYGPEVDGTLTAYFPYCAEGYPGVALGRVPYASVQEYRQSAGEHFTANTVFASRLEDGLFDFEIRSGLVKFEVETSYTGEIKGVDLISGSDWLCGNFSLDSDAEEPVTQGGKSVSVRGMGVRTEKFDVWIALPAGSYQALQLVVRTDAETVTKPVNGVVPVRAGEVTSMTVVDEAYEYTGSDFVIIPGIFD